MKSIIHKAKQILKKLRRLSSLVDFLRNILLLPKAITYIYNLLFVSLVSLGIYLRIVQDKIYNILQIKIFELHIVLRVWIIPILILIPMTFILIIIGLLRKRKQKNILSQSEQINFEPYLGYNWRWGRDSVGKIIIDDMPYCINHKKRFRKRQYHEYTCSEPNCGEGIVSVRYWDIIKDVKKYIIDKYGNY